MKETKYTVKYTTSFKKDYKRAIKRGLKIELLNQVVALLAMGEPLPDKNRDHDLCGDWAGHRECHILPDWLLVYRIEDDVLVLTLGPHRHTQRLVRQINSAVWGNLYGGFSVCKECRNATHLTGVRQNAVALTAPAPGRETCPVPVGTAARRFCGAVPLLSNPPAWISWQACPSAFQRPADLFPAAMPSE